MTTQKRLNGGHAISTGASGKHLTKKDPENHRQRERKTTLTFTKGEASLLPHSLTLVKVSLKR